MITKKKCIETTDISKDTFYKLAQIRELPNKRAGKHNQNYEGVIFFCVFEILFFSDFQYRLLPEFPVSTRLCGLWNKTKSHRHEIKYTTEKPGHKIKS